MLTVVVTWGVWDDWLSATDARKPALPARLRLSSPSSSGLIFPLPSCERQRGPARQETADPGRERSQAHEDRSPLDRRGHPRRLLRSTIQVTTEGIAPTTIVRAARTFGSSTPSRVRTRTATDAAKAVVSAGRRIGSVFARLRAEVEVVRVVA